MHSLTTQKAPLAFLTFFSDLFAEKSSSSFQAENNFSLQTSVKTLSPSALYEVPSATLNAGVTKNLHSSDLLSAICHELKTPLNAIIAFSEILKDEVGNPKSVAECQEYTKEIIQAAFELNEIVHDLLDVGAVNSGNFSVDMSKKCDVSDVVKRAVRLNYDYALRRNISLKSEVSEDVKKMEIKLDAKRMKQILTNLISNAVKYSDKGSEVKVSCRKNNLGTLEIAVSDQGFGMTQSQIQLSFQKYQTFNNPNRGVVDSFGLGLSIVKQLTELMNGTIEIKSEINHGTEVVLRFPYLM